MANVGGFLGSVYSARSQGISPAFSSAGDPRWRYSTQTHWGVFRSRYLLSPLHTTSLFLSKVKQCAGEEGTWPRVGGSPLKPTPQSRSSAGTAQSSRVQRTEHQAVGAKPVPLGPGRWAGDRHGPETPRVKAHLSGKHFSKL